MSANWPIRVGGEYVTNISSGIRRVVAAIDGDQIHFRLRSEYSQGVWSDLHHGDVIDAETFRCCSVPEDASPIPDLIAALKKAQRFIAEVDALHQTIYWGGLDEECKEALAKAGAA